MAPEAIHTICASRAPRLVLNSIERQIPAIAAMNAMIETLSALRETFTNAYVSFNRDSAFKAHFDPHNVLILQLHGRKRLWCYGQKTRSPWPARRLPTTSFRQRNGKAFLEPGDILFVPRGDVHRACVEDVNSVHLDSHHDPAQPGGMCLPGSPSRL